MAYTVMMMMMMMIMMMMLMHAQTCLINDIILMVLLFPAVRAQSVQRWATGWTIGVLWFDSRRGLGIFLFTTASRTALGPTQPPT
jgi:hypothetical protein